MKKVHFLGIGGSGASAIAKIAEAQGFEVTGCDLFPHNEFASIFQKNQLFEGHSPKHLQNIDILAVTPAIYSLDPENPELQEAKGKNIEILTWQEFMGKYLQNEGQVIAVCGTHGKSTTTAMIGLLLEDAGLDPTVQLGAIIPRWGSNYRVGNGKYFVTEADEYNDNFLATHPNITVVTTVEMDHPEYFKDFETYKKSFTKFLYQTKEKIIANLSDKGVNSVIARSPSITLRTTKQSGQEIASPAVRNDRLVDYSKEIIDFELKVPGKHNKLNASAAFQAGLTLGIKPEIIKKSLEGFEGIGRRFEYLGKFHESEVYSDFGHHPTELKVTLETAASQFPDKKITVIFQPHMFSRTKALFNDFVEVLKNLDVDKIYIMNIYKSREIDSGLVNSKQLVEAINQDNVLYLPTESDILSKFKTEAGENEILFFIGAGDIHDLAKSIITN